MEYESKESIRRSPAIPSFVPADKQHRTRSASRAATQKRKTSSARNSALYGDVDSIKEHVPEARSVRQQIEDFPYSSSSFNFSKPLRSLNTQNLDYVLINFAHPFFYYLCGLACVSAVIFATLGSRSSLPEGSSLFSRMYSMAKPDNAYSQWLFPQTVLGKVSAFVLSIGISNRIHSAWGYAFGSHGYHFLVPFAMILLPPGLCMLGQATYASYCCYQLYNRCGSFDTTRLGFQRQKPMRNLLSCVIIGFQLASSIVAMYRPSMDIVNSSQDNIYTRNNALNTNVWMNKAAPPTVYNVQIQQEHRYLQDRLGNFGFGYRAPVSTVVKPENTGFWSGQFEKFKETEPQLEGNTIVEFQQYKGSTDFGWDRTPLVETKRVFVNNPFSPQTIISPEFYDKDSQVRSDRANPDVTLIFHQGKLYKRTASGFEHYHESLDTPPTWSRLTSFLNKPQEITTYVPVVETSTPTLFSVTYDKTVSSVQRLQAFAALLTSLSAAVLVALHRFYHWVPFSFESPLYPDQVTKWINFVNRNAYFFAAIVTLVFSTLNYWTNTIAPTQMYFFVMEFATFISKIKVAGEE